MKNVFDTIGNTMEWDITTHKNYNYIEIVTKGVADNNDSMEMAKIIADTMRHGRITRALIDHRNITGVSGSTLNIVDRPKLFRLIGLLFGIKLAAIINPDHAEHFKFLETVCMNQGYTYSVFYDKTKGLNWLLNLN
jgi:hypothetical protein